MNVTQEGKSAVDDLREMGFVNGLKLTSEDFQPITAFQVSLKVQLPPTTLAATSNNTGSYPQQH
jgi:hypothetical protein